MRIIKCGSRIAHCRILQPATDDRNGVYAKVYTEILPTCVIHSAGRVQWKYRGREMAERTPCTLYSHSHYARPGGITRFE